MTSMLYRQRTTSMNRWTAPLGALATAALLAGGCGSSKPGGTPDGGGGPDGGGATCVASGSGMLKVAVTGLPDGATPMIQLKGGGLTAPMVLTIGTPVTIDARGGYEIFYRRYKTAPAAGSAVGNAYYISATDFTGCIKDGVTTTATLTYTKEPGSGKMYMSVANATPGDHLIAGFDGTDLAASGTKTPSVWKSKNFTGRAAAGAFDSFGNLWMPGGDKINEYAMETLAMTSAAAPAVKIDQPAGSAAKFAAFDSVGNLWISRGAPTTDNSVVRYAVNPADGSIATTTSVVIKNANDMVNPAGIAFDDQGALWVASEGNDKVLKYGAAHLAADYSGAADVVITTKTAASGVPITDSPYTNPAGLAFDKAGNLWVGYEANTVKLTVAQLGASGDLGGVFAIDLATGTGGFVFDESGGIWCPGPGIGAPQGEHSFQHIPAAMLGAGMATPDITIDSADLGSVETIVLDPSPTWSPLHDTL